MACPFRSFPDLAKVWAQTSCSVYPKLEVFVTLHFPEDTFAKLQEHLKRDAAILALTRLLHITTSQIHTRYGNALSAQSIESACTLTLEQVNAIMEASENCDAATICLFDKSIKCFKWSSPVTDLQDQTQASDAEFACADLLNRANKIILQAHEVVHESQGRNTNLIEALS